jgi:hypothetical protein
MGGKRAVSLIAAVALLAFGAGASSTQALGRLPFQVLLSADGSGQIFMNNGSRPSWQACRPDLSACTPFATGNFSTGGAPAETVFWAGGDLITPIWRGNVREAAPPSVQGRVRGNEVVAPVAGLWAGGWDNDYDDLSLSVCKTAAGERCLAIDYEGEEGDCGAGGAVLIDPAFAGRYLRVVDRRYGAGTLFAGVGHAAYYPLGEVETAATTAVAVVGKIAPATGPPSVECGPPPLFDASISGDGSAQVECSIVSCRAVLIARRGGRSARLERKLPATPLATNPQSVTLRLAASSLERLAGGPIRVTVKINGRAIARRTVKVGRLPVVAEYPDSLSVGGRAR